MRIFTEQTPCGEYVITGEDAKHIGVSMRARLGEKITLCDGRGTDFESEIIGFASNEVRVKILSEKANTAEPKVAVTVYQCVAKGDKMETVVQKSVELGAAEIVPVLSSRCISRPDRALAEKKRLRYSKIAREAAEQSGRGRIPAFGEMLSFGSMLGELANFDAALFLYEGGGAPLSAAIAEHPARIAVIIGPEGGFSPDEAAAATAAGATEVTLGHRILRTETASACVLSAIMYEYGEMS